MAFPAGFDKNNGPTHDSRAASIQARTLEILDSVSLADEFVQAGNICHAAATYTSDHKLIKYLTFDELTQPFPSFCNCHRARQSV
jgi:2-polyprenyl-6-methoxyphenol hydroxylase-like FAD-dependent oxidoreductase